MKQKQHDVLMKAQKRERAGNKLRDSNSQAKILLDFKKEQAGQSLGAIQSQHHRQIEQSQQDLKNKNHFWKLLNLNNLYSPLFKNV